MDLNLNLDQKQTLKQMLKSGEFYSVWARKYRAVVVDMELYRRRYMKPPPEKVNWKKEGF